MLRWGESSLLGDRGQMSVELAVVLPVTIVVAVIAVNALLFFGECAQFDRVGRNAVRICAASPAAGQDLSQVIAAVDSMVGKSMDADNVECDVTAGRIADGITRFDLVLRYWPTLFGLGLKREVLGVPLPPLTHSVSLSVDMHKPGIVL